MMPHGRACHHIREEISRLATFFRSEHRENVLIPLQSGSKSPAMAHKGGRFTWDDWDACMKSGQEYKEFGVLARTLVVVDADSPEAVEWLEDKYPALLECPCAQTRKGKHYYFLRSPLCEEKNVTDSIGVWEHVDLKTVTGSLHDHVSRDGSKIATAGVVVVPPSTNKSWHRSILDTPLEFIPDEIIHDVLASSRNSSGKGKRDVTQRIKRRGEGAAAGDPQHPVVEQVKRLLIQVCNDSTSVLDNMNVDEEGAVSSLYFRNGPGGRRCPGGHHHVSNNFYVHCYTDGGRSYYCLSSECRKGYPLGTLENEGAMVTPTEAIPPLPSMEQTLALLRDCLAPRRFENLQALAGVVKSCFGKNSFHVFSQLAQGATACPPVEQLEATFLANRGDDDAGKLKRWAREDSPDKWEALRALYLGPPSMEDKMAAESLLAYVRSRHGYEFLYCSPGVQYFWDGKRFHDNADDAYTCKVCLEHGEDIARIYNVSSKMYSGNGRIKGICGVLRGLTVDREAHSKMNQNTKLLGFDDGVLELDTGTFRPKKYSDYVTMSMGYDFPTTRDPVAEAEVLEFFKNVHRDESVREFVLYRLASCLDGCNSDEIGPMWTGASGANGKSKMAELMGAVMGEYGGTLESSQLTTARTSGAANSQLASVMFRRFLVIEEPDTMCKTWNWEKFKEITGRAEVQVRELYQRPISMRPHFTPILIFNSLPEGCTKVDKGVQRRLEVVPFESEFVLEPKLPHQFPIASRLSDKFGSWKRHLFNILYHDYYKKHVLTHRPIRKPARCVDTEGSILDSGQVVGAWFEERVIQDPEGLLTLSDAKDDFYGNWIDASGHRCDGITLSGLKKQLCGLMNREPVPQLCNKLTNNVKLTNVWRGFKLRSRECLVTGGEGTADYN
jgi:hypothetical protein